VDDRGSRGDGPTAKSVQCADFAHTLSRRVPAFLETDALRLCRGSLRITRRLERANSAFVGAEQFGIIRRDGAQRAYV